MKHALLERPIRANYTLTAAMASAIEKIVLSGETVYPESGRLTLAYTEDGVAKYESLSTYTLMAWVRRDNVVPGTNKTLRVMLDEARVERRRAESENRQNAIREQAEKQLEAITGIKIKPVETTRKYRIDRETGEPVLSSIQEVEGGARMTEALVKGITFGLERLDPTRYGSKVETKNTHVIFDLTALRRRKELYDELNPEQ